MNIEKANTKDVTCENGFISSNTDLCHNNWGHRVVLCCYNPKTHIAFQCGLVGGQTITIHESFYLDNVLCGLYCDIDGKNCGKGVCVANACENGYNNLGILTTEGLYPDFIFYKKGQTKYVVCYNNSKYYNVFEPNIKKSVILKDIKRVNN